ncbi:MAG: ABC transporter substrate binding protein [Thermodesulfobacteriota bacterium]|nr:ABC transporter substrate binding protein [Thermodesulfobacteriota bacterium]
MFKKTLFLLPVALLSLCAFAFASAYGGKKILYVNSYHEGYAWSDEITAGIQSVLKGTDIHLKILDMDTKRNTSEEFKNEAGSAAKRTIDAFNPDIVITSDDNAFKYVIMPYYRDAGLPVVFCGLNWDASIYGAPYKNTTGMIEVALIPQLLEQLRQYTRGDRVGYLAADVLTARKEGEYYRKLFKLAIQEVYVKTFDEWKAAFVDIQKDIDMLIVGNNAGINDWDDKGAAVFAQKNTKIPTGVIYNWLMPYSLLGFTKVEKEQGEWAARAALRILDGTSPSDIPVVRNKEGNLILNLAIADRLGVVFSLSMVRNATIIDKE